MTCALRALATGLLLIVLFSAAARSGAATEIED